MTSPHEPDPEEIARLRQQLADAVAEVERLSARLDAVTGGAADGTPGQPIVIRTGPVDLEGNPVDLDEALGEERAAQVRARLAALGMGDVLPDPAARDDGP